MKAPTKVRCVPRRVNNSSRIRYLRPRKSYYNSDGNPFTEAVNVEDDMLGGYGIFAVESIDEREVE